MRPAPVYRRRSGCVSRALSGRGWVAAPGRSTIVIEGSALFVWLVLDVESSVDELTAEIRATWPELGTVSTSAVQDALDALVDNGVVVETLRSPDSEASST